MSKLQVDDIVNKDDTGSVGFSRGVVVTGVLTATSFSGGASGDFTIEDKIVHTGDTNTAIRFPAADTFSVETGGSERFRVTSDGKVGINSASPHQALDIGGTTVSLVKFTPSNYGSGASDGAQIGVNFGGLDVWQFENNYLRLGTNNTERIRVTSGGLIGIGTAGPDSILHINPTADCYVTLEPGSTDGNAGLLMNNSVGAQKGYVIYDTDDNFLRFGTDNTERVRIDSNGKTGININNPGSYNSSGNELVLGNTSSNAGMTIVSNSSNNGHIFFADGTASGAQNRGIIKYEHGNDAMAFNTAENEALRIDSSGRVLVNASSSTQAGSIDARAQVVSSDFNAALAIRRNQNGDGGAGVLLCHSRGTSNSANVVVQDNDNLGQIRFFGADNTGSNDFAEGAAISASVDGTPGNDDMPSRLEFKTTADGASSPTERARITSKGAFKATTDGTYQSTTSTSHEFCQSNASVYALRVEHSGTTPTGILIDYSAVTQNDTGSSFIQGEDATTFRFRFASNGGLYNYQANNSNLCDEREKKNIVSLDSKWDKVKNWELKKFHYNEDADTDDLRYGVIAQQVEGGCPEVLVEWVKQEAKDAVLDGNGNVVTPAQAEVVRKGVKEQQMMWMAIKALQEAQTRIETLETKVAALEGS